MYKNPSRLLSYHTQKFTQNKDLNVGPETMKLLEKKTGKCFVKLASTRDFQICTSKAQPTKSKNRQNTITLHLKAFAK